jgi:hypothetical protein
MAEQSPWQVIWAPTKPEQRQGQVLAGPTRPQRLPTSTATRGDARRTTDRMLREAGRPRSPADEFLASLEEQRLAAMGGGGGGNRNAMFDTRRQMLEDLYAQQLQSVQGMYDQGMGQIGTSLDGTLGSLGNIRDQYMAQAAQMQQDQAAMLAGALGRVAQEQAMLNADLAAQGGRTVDPAAFDARGVLEAQGANQSALQSRLAELQAGAFADREGGAQSIAQGGRQQLDLQRLALQDQILRERLQALTDVDVQRVQAEQAAAAARAGGGGGPGGLDIDAILGYPPGTFDASPAATQNIMLQSALQLGEYAPTAPDVAGIQLVAGLANGDPNQFALLGAEFGLSNDDILIGIQGMTAQAQQAARANAGKGRGSLSTPFQRAAAQVTGRRVETRPLVQSPRVPNPQRVAQNVIQSGLRLFGG